MDLPICDNLTTTATTTNGNLLSRVFKNDHINNTHSLASARKELEHGILESDQQQIESSSPITMQPNSVNTTSTKPDEEATQGDSILYQANLLSLSNTNTNSTAADNTPTINKKSTPKRAMILSGRPASPLPPRPIFPADLENYQLQSGTVVSNEHMQAYLARVRQDFEQQTEHFEVLKEVLLEDTHHMTAVVDELDAMDEDPFTLDSFENLMRLHAGKDKDFILARVTTQDPNDENKHYHSYYGAHQINKVLFRTQPDEGLLHRMKARNPLNNMLVVGDVHYYIISAADVKAVRPLPAICSSSSSISSHSSRMSRCSKLAAQAFAIQSASARSSPILGSDMSLFSGTSDIDSPLSIISPLMALSILKADQEDPFHHLDLIGADGGPGSSAVIPTGATEQDVIQPLKPHRRGSQGTTSSTTSTPTLPQGGLTFHHQPGRPSRLRQAIETKDFQDLGPSSDGPVAVIRTTGAGSFAEGDTQVGTFSPMTPPIHNHHSSGSSQASPSSAAGQSPLFQSLMGGRIRGRSNTVSSVSSDQSSVSTMSARSHASKCSTATNDSSATANSSNSECYSPSESNATTNSTENQSSSKGNDGGIEDNVVYKFRYLASDDDFLLRSTVRQTFKTNALESWDAILFTISHNALREYSGQDGEHSLQPLGGAHGHLQQLQQHQQSLPSSPAPVSAQAHSQQHQQSQQELAVTSLPITTTAAAAVAAHYSQSLAQGSNLPPLVALHSQEIALPSSVTEFHHQQPRPSSSNTSSFDSEDSTRAPSSPLHRRIGRSGEGLYSADVSSTPRGFNIQSFTHTPRHQSQGGHEDLRQEGGRGLPGAGLSRSMSHNCHNRRMDLFRSLPVLPLGASVSASAFTSSSGGGGADGEGFLEGACGGEVAESMCGSSRTTIGGRKKFRHVFSKIFSRK
ncbi:hypothetical protein BGZ96_009484 [Linnemannia gamsii]|uniref:Uncharacterized protein n=1 Tax=Linnemannia gamsii TaxID=64522 RepID=A0ABQ7JWC0_9FUNG|nr:hypothetical protein BGZ96_009484 [Linnemannia gamsii]